MQRVYTAVEVEFLIGMACDRISESVFRHTDPQALLSIQEDIDAIKSQRAESFIPTLDTPLEWQEWQMLHEDAAPPPEVCTADPLTTCKAKVIALLALGVSILTLSGLIIHIVA